MTPRHHPYIENGCATRSRMEPYSGTQECWNPTDRPCILRLFPMAGAVHGAWGQNEQVLGSYPLCDDGNVLHRHNSGHGPHVCPEHSEHG